MKDLCIHLDQTAVLAGEIITGKVILTTNPKPMEAQHIQLMIRGDSNVHWTETRSESYSTTDSNGKSVTKSQTVTVTYSSYIKIFDHQLMLWSKADYKTGTIDAGSHVFPFQFRVPVNCPTLFTGHDGKVAYFCHAEVDRPEMLKFNLRKDATFRVINPNSKLEQFANTELPCLDEARIRTGIIFGRGTLNVKARLMKSGFVPGDTMEVELMIRNEAPKAVTGVEFQVVRFAIFKASCGKTRKQSITLYDDFKELLVEKEASGTFLHPIIVHQIEDDAYSFDTGNICLHFEVQVRLKYGKRLTTSYLTLPFVFARSREADTKQEFEV